jgi:hypothetical protein
VEHMHIFVIYTLEMLYVSYFDIFRDRKEIMIC